MSTTQALIKLIRGRTHTKADLDAAALFVLDTLATAYAGSATATGQKFVDWAGGSNGGLHRDVLLMGALAHITETDDLHRASVSHPACVVIPVALALGEATHASGERILRAILEGYEAMCRVGAALGPAHYRVWHNTATAGPFGSAMTAARLLDLDDEQTLHALGNAGTQSSGFWEFMQTGAMSKHLHAGRAAEAGLLAAELARSGITGAPAILEGEKGLFAAMCPDPVPSAVLAAPDGEWQLRRSSIKPWPSCRHTHPIIDCALSLHHLIDAQSLREIHIETYQAAVNVCDRPLPDSEYQAKFSLYHCAAIALLDGAVGLDSFDDSARARTADLRAVTSVEVGQPFAENYPGAWGSALRVVDRHGNSERAERLDCYGDPESPIDTAGMRTKARGLLSHAGVDDDSATTLCERILQLPDAAGQIGLFSDFLDATRAVR